ncbi:MAG: hypothetical protein A3G43_04035 [Ignavibacteria bacterium RIFCSPLOWO2_12_FULL_56_21]|nr:MAG: hypothetical protein A3G43_04035 [Ignavibacteria bacterium RIFCSPLOWO2_12_FULL_56_21]
MKHAPLHTRFLCFAVLLLIASSLGCHGRADKVRITLRVVPPKSTPPGDTLYVAGSVVELGMWSPNGLALNPGADGVWSVTRAFPSSMPVEFKITRGTWETEAIYEAGQIPGNTRMMPVHDTTVTLTPVTWRDQMPRPPGGIHGMARYHRQLSGSGLKYRRDVIVWLPPSYAKNPRRRYPVLYMHDGQNVFDPSTATIGRDWRADEVADSLIHAGSVEEMIIVAINNSADRMVEYSETVQGRAYAGFVVHTVKPMIDSLYRTKRGPHDTAVMGSSMGGLISFLFIWWHPDVFGKAGCLSSVFHRRHSSVLDSVSRMEPGSRTMKLYIDCGGSGGDETLKPGMDEMADLLGQKGFREGEEFAMYYDPRAEHNEPAWSARLWRPFTFLFPRN